MASEKAPQRPRLPLLVVLGVGSVAVILMFVGGQWLAAWAAFLTTVVGLLVLDQLPDVEWAWRMTRAQMKAASLAESFVSPWEKALEAVRAEVEQQEKEGKDEP